MQLSSSTSLSPLPLHSVLLLQGYMQPLDIAMKVKNIELIPNSVYISLDVDIPSQNLKLVLASCLAPSIAVWMVNDSELELDGNTHQYHYTCKLSCSILSHHPPIRIAHHSTAVLPLLGLEPPPPTLTLRHHSFYYTLL
jgi:hypothetical protein